MATSPYFYRVNNDSFHGTSSEEKNKQMQEQKRSAAMSLGGLSPKKRRNHAATTTATYHPPMGENHTVHPSENQHDGPNKYRYTLQPYAYSGQPFLPDVHRFGPTYLPAPHPGPDYGIYTPQSHPRHCPLPFRASYPHQPYHSSHLPPQNGGNEHYGHYSSPPNGISYGMHAPPPFQQAHPMQSQCAPLSYNPSRTHQYGMTAYEEEAPSITEPSVSPIGRPGTPEDELMRKEMRRVQRRRLSSRARMHKFNEMVEEILRKPEQERTEEEKSLVRKKEERRHKKNSRSRERSKEKKLEMERISSKPFHKRTREEQAFLEVAMEAKRRKNEADRNRRKRNKLMAIKNKKNESNLQRCNRITSEEAEEPLDDDVRADLPELDYTAIDEITNFSLPPV